MTKVIVNDASCLIDLHKGRLLHAMMTLPFDFVVPAPIRESELLDFTPQEWQMLDDSGLETVDLDSDQMRIAVDYKGRYNRLSARDCICLVTAQQYEDVCLLTGDRLLRRTAQDHSLTTHGVLWIVDHLMTSEQDFTMALRTALQLWRGDIAVFLPAQEIDLRLGQLK